MLRTLVIVVGIFLFGEMTASAREIVDANNSFRVTVPDDWTQMASPPSSVALVVVSPRAAQTGGNCNVSVTMDAASKGKTQAEIDASASAEVNDQFWLAVLGATGLFKSTTIDSSGERTHRGRKVFHVKATSEMANVPAKITQLLSMHPLPGQIFVASCTALAEKFADEEAVFDAILASFDPSAEATVSLPRPDSPWMRAPSTVARVAAPVVGRAVDAGVRTGFGR